MKQSQKYFFPFILVTSLFFLWAFLHNINPILIPHLKKACRLTDTQSAFVDTAVYAAYFLIALPAGWIMYKFGYKKGILAGLFLYGAGSLLFIPAANAGSYLFFLVALFIMASGATFLETVANPYIAKLGDDSSSASRLNFAQSFNGVGAVVAPLIGGELILSGVKYTEKQLEEMDPVSLQAYLNTEASTVKIPYLVIGVGVLILFAVFFVTRLPEIKNNNETSDSPRFSLAVFRHPQLKWAVVAQFFYVGAQTCVGSFFIRFSEYTAGVSEKRASFLWAILAMVGFMAGRFLGTFFMTLVRPARLLGIYAIINIALLALAIGASGPVAIYALMAVPFFMSIMFPTIFAIGIAGLGEETKIASSFIVMSIVGGAIFPLLMGQVSDLTGGNIQLAYIIPALCFVVIAVFAWRFRNVFTKERAAAH